MISQRFLKCFSLLPLFLFIAIQSSQGLSCEYSTISYICLLLSASINKPLLCDCVPFCEYFVHLNMSEMSDCSLFPQAFSLLTHILFSNSLHAYLDHPFWDLPFNVLNDSPVICCFLKCFENSKFKNYSFFALKLLFYCTHWLSEFSLFEGQV